MDQFLSAHQPPGDSPAPAAGGLLALLNNNHKKSSASASASMNKSMSMDHNKNKSRELHASSSSSSSSSCVEGSEGKSMSTAFKQWESADYMYAPQSQSHSESHSQSQRYLSLSEVNYQTKRQKFNSNSASQRGWRVIDGQKVYVTMRSEGMVKATGQQAFLLSKADKGKATSKRKESNIDGSVVEGGPGVTNRPKSTTVRKETNKLTSFFATETSKNKAPSKKRMQPSNEEDLHSTTVHTTPVSPSVTSGIRAEVADRCKEQAQIQKRDEMQHPSNRSVPDNKTTTAASLASLFSF